LSEIRGTFLSNSKAIWQRIAGATDLVDTTGATILSTDSLIDELRAAGPLRLVVFDFDGVFTDNSVWVREDGVESVQCSRADGIGIARLHAIGMEMLVLSTEKNPVVGARCRKLNIPHEQAISDKGARLSAILIDRSIDPRQVAYIGNDVNDMGCLRLVGLPVVVADADPSVLPFARATLNQSGGHGAVREFCDAVADHSVRFSGKDGA